MSNCLEILDKLVGFNTVSHNSNVKIIDFIQDFCGRRGASIDRVSSYSGEKVGLIARFGPNVEGGLIFSGHTDVVPTSGQSWTRPAFRLTRENGLLYGRGTTDMKGFLACIMSLVENVATTKLVKPLTLIFSYDEEVGCIGIKEMKCELVGKLGSPAVCIVGEPTEMQIVVGHKGKTAFQAHCIGQVGHSAMAPKFVNALHVAADFVFAMQKIQTYYSQHCAHDEKYDIPYSTFHVGKLNSGTVLNIVPDHAEINFESRYLVKDGEERICSDIIREVDKINQKYGKQLGRTAISFQKTFSYPGLEISETASATRIGLGLVENKNTTKVAFGTEAGVFSELGIPTIVCGPGSMAGQGHQPDEYITIEQLSACERFLRKSLDLII